MPHVSRDEMGSPKPHLRAWPLPHMRQDWGAGSTPCVVLCISHAERTYAHGMRPLPVVSSVSSSRCSESSVSSDGAARPEQR